MSPFNKLQIFLQIDKPRPTPFGLRDALDLSVVNSLKSFFASTSEMPQPVSLTDRKISAPLFGS